MSRPGENILLLFGTTHASLEAEESIIRAGFWCDVVPRPPEASDSLCGLAIAVGADDLDEIASQLRAEGIEFETYTGGALRES